MRSEPEKLHRRLLVRHPQQLACISKEEQEFSPNRDSHIRQRWLAVLSPSSFTKTVCYVWSKQWRGRRKGNPQRQKVDMPTCLIQDRGFANFLLVMPAVMPIPLPYKTWTGPFVIPVGLKDRGKWYRQAEIQVWYDVSNTMWYRSLAFSSTVKG